MLVHAGTITKGDKVADTGKLPWEVVSVGVVGKTEVVLTLRNEAGCAATWRLGVAELVRKA